MLYNPAGVKNENNFSIATPERAFLDMIYLFPKYYFDNLKSINWEQCFELAKIYANQQLIKRLTKYQKNLGLRLKNYKAASGIGSWYTGYVE